MYQPLCSKAGFARNPIRFEQKHAKIAKKERESLPPEAGTTFFLGDLCGLLFAFSPPVMRCFRVAYLDGTV